MSGLVIQSKDAPPWVIRVLDNLKCDGITTRPREIKVYAEERYHFFGGNCYYYVTRDGGESYGVQYVGDSENMISALPAEQKLFMGGDLTLDTNTQVLVEHLSYPRHWWALHVHPSCLNKLMLPPKMEITWAEHVVLVATRSLKSSYAGISNYRLHEARSMTGITTQEWNDAVATLKSRKLLNAAGAITTAGKNTVGTLEGLWNLKRPAS